MRLCATTNSRTVRGAAHSIGWLAVNDRLNDRLQILATPAVRDLGDSTLMPRLDARAVEGLNRLHDARAAAIGFEWRGQTWRVHWCHDDERMLPPLDAYRFRLGARSGTLALDRPAQAELLGEPRAEALPQELRTILLADAAHGVVAALSAATRLSFEWLPVADAAPPASHAPKVQFRVARADAASGSGWRGWLRFDDADAWAQFAPPLGAALALATGAQPFAHLRYPLRWCIGATSIRLGEVRSIRPGDLVGVEQWRSHGAAIVAEAELGGRRLVALAEGSRITIQQTRELTMNRPTDPTNAAAPAGDLQEAAGATLDRLDALEVQLRFEVGDLEVSLGELRHLRAGHVFELGQPLNRSSVRILAHGNVLGQGHLVAVGERLGVRVSEFAAGEL